MTMVLMFSAPGHTKKAGDRAVPRLSTAGSARAADLAPPGVTPQRIDRVGTTGRDVVELLHQTRLAPGGVVLVDHALLGRLVQRDHRLAQLLRVGLTGLEGANG